MSAGLKAKSGKFNKVMLILAPLLITALVICVYNFISIQVEISQKKEELAKLTAQVTEVEMITKCLADILRTAIRSSTLKLSQGISLVMLSRRNVFII